MSVPEYFISCDWGTSNFRLRLVETQTLRVCQEHRTPVGVKSLHEQYVAQGGGDQLQFFADYLSGELTHFPEGDRSHQIVACGMASANIGLKNLAYASLPITSDGKSLLAESLAVNGLQILLVSGVKAQDSMMRGEEIQAVGLADHLQDYERAVLLLPGTHSKHIHYADGVYHAFSTYMTGELFDVLTKQSLLASSVVAGSWTADRQGAFEEGVKLGLEGQMSNSLFKVRAKEILDGQDKKDNYYLLSGLLIGDELASLQGVNQQVVMAAASPIFDLYQLALNTFLPSDQLVLLGDKAQEEALLAGQRKILTYHE